MKNILFFLSFMLFIGACKDRYNPPAVSFNSSFLVVEGYLNGSGTTSIKLSRTFKLADSASVTLEQNAQVKVESNTGSSYSLAPKGSGVYEAQIVFNPAQQYRLHVITSGNKEYLSDYVVYKVTPAVDSISWRRNSSGVQVYVNAHDDQNKTIYYRWDYDETWAIQSAFYSNVEYRNKMIVTRNPAINIFYCWQSQTSTRILLGSSAKLTKDVISMSPVTAIPNGSLMLSVKYSILLRQYALPEKAYQYWLNLQKNTENLGSIFDPLPSEISGNIHCVTTPSEPVIGFISAGTVQSKRIFISNSEVSNWGYYEDCELDFVPNIKDSIDFYFSDGYYSPTTITNSPSGAPGYNFSSTGCIDCTLRGTNVKPSFWQ